MTRMGRGPGRDGSGVHAYEFRAAAPTINGTWMVVHDSNLADTWVRGSTSERCAVSTGVPRRFKVSRSWANLSTSLEVDIAGEARSDPSNHGEKRGDYA